MDKKKAALIREGWALFTRIFMQYDIAEKRPLAVGNGETLNAASIHMIEAVGKGYGTTVTSLSNYFMVTKGAVSQTIKSLHQKGFMAKTKRKSNDKEIILELTKKGRQAFSIHEKTSESAMRNLVGAGEKYSVHELQAFLDILKEIDRLVLGYPLEEK